MNFEGWVIKIPSLTLLTKQNAHVITVLLQIVQLMRLVYSDAYINRSEKQGCDI